MKEPTVTPPHDVGAGPRRAAVRRFPAAFGRSASPAVTDATYDLSLLARSRARWESSAGLRLIYGDIFKAMRAQAAPGPALELGSGCGALRDVVPDVVTSDVASTTYADLAVSAYAIEDAPGGPWSTIYLFDVLHHLREPLRFFASASRALRPGGRVVICDPAATLAGRWFYRAFHHEPVAPDQIVAPYALPPDSPAGGFANMGMGWALFARDRAGLAPSLRQLGLALRGVRFRDVFAYPASGGFSGPRLLPAVVLRGLLAAERALPQSWLRRLGLRMLVVLEKSPD